MTTYPGVIDMDTFYYATLVRKDTKSEAETKRISRASIRRIWEQSLESKNYILIYGLRLAGPQRPEVTKKKGDCSWQIPSKKDSLSKLFKT